MGSMAHGQQQHHHPLLPHDCDAGDGVQPWPESHMPPDIFAFPTPHPSFFPSSSNPFSSTELRDSRGHHRSPALCREKWRNLVRKLKHHSPTRAFLKDACSSFSDTINFQPNFAKGMEPAALNLERRLENDGQTTTSVMSLECPLQNGKNDWGWRDGCTDVPPWENGIGCHHHTAAASAPAGRVIVVKWGELTRKIGIDGSAHAIKDAIRSTFGLRSKRSFWVEDEDGVVRSFDRTMPLTNYTLHIDPGVTIKLCHYDECSRQAMHTEDATLYNEDDFRELLSRYGWQGLREVGTYKDVESIQELRPMATYHHSGFKGMGL